MNETADLQERHAELLRQHPRKVELAALFLGVLSSLTYAPFGLWPIAPLVCAGMLGVFLVSTPRRAARLGFLFGFGLFLSGTYWIYVSVHVFGQAPLIIALALMFGLVLIMSTYLALTGWLTSRLAAGSALRLLAAGPAVWAVVEWLRGWLFTGFPWMSLGYAHIDSPLAGIAPVLGVYGVSLALLVSAAGLVACVLRRRPYLAAAVALGPWLVGAALTQWQWTAEAGEPLTVTLVQGGVSQDQKWLPEQFQPTLELYRTALNRHAASDIVVWPEVAIPAVDVRVLPYLDRLQADLRTSRQTLAMGILEANDSQTQVYNSVLVLDGQTTQAYRKRHLVPFGEYFPVPDKVREWLRLLSLPNTDMLAGADEQPILVSAGGVPMTAAICYEDAYGAEQLYALPDAALLINVSNDAWFGDSIAPHQHLQVARMRALEVGRPVLRATNNGITAFIDAQGTLVSTAPQFEFAALTANVTPRSGATPYVRTGNWSVLALLYALLAICIIGRKRSGA